MTPRIPSDHGPFGEFAADRLINLGAPDDADERAAYFDEQAAGHERMAAQEADPEMVEVNEMFAEQFRRRASQLRQGR